MRHPAPLTLIAVGLLFSSVSCFAPTVSVSKRGPPTLAAATTARDSGLALLLDDGTRKSHSVAENTAFVSGFFRGMSSKGSFAQLTASLYFVYEAMENAFAAEDAAEEVKAMDYSSLRRLEALEQDMAYFHGENWRSRVVPSPATQAYVARINQLQMSSDPEQRGLLVAHQYTRYLGDLFGGQMMAGMATRSLGLDNGKGVAFYDFPQIGDSRAFIEQWYEAANGLPLSESQKQALVDEANLVFRHNIAVFEELEGSAVSAMWRLGASAFLTRLREANPAIRAWLPASS